MECETAVIEASAAPAVRPRRVHGLMWAATAVLASGAVADIFLAREATAVLGHISQSTGVALDLERLRGDLMSAGRGVQEALIDGRSAQQAVDGLRAGALADWQRIREQMVDDVDQTRRLAELRVLMDERYKLLRQLMTDTGGAINPTALDPGAGARQRVNRAIEELLDTMHAEQEAVRTEGERSLGDIARASGALLVSLALLVLVLQALGGLSVRAESQRSARSEAEARNATAALRKLNEELESRVRERTLALNERSGDLGRMHARLSSVSQDMLHAVERERRALARELHDDFGQQMAALKINLQMMRRYPQEGTGRLDDSVEVVEACIARLRELAIRLRPAMLDELGLRQALTAHTDRQARRAGMAFELDLQPQFDAGSEDWTIAVFRIVQEALRNVESHAGATRIWLSLRDEEGEAVLRVRDDGHGLPLARDDAVEGMGLMTMRERTELLRGRFSLQTVQPHGVELVCRWPLREALASACSTADVGV